jgi:hypothetical protein
MYILFLSRILLIITALNYVLIKLLNINLFGFIKNSDILAFLHLIMAIVIIYYLFNRDFYLPFLGETVIPIKNMNNIEDNLLNFKIQNLPPNKRLIYWASRSSDQVIRNPIDAYKGYTNSGITKTDSNGNASLEISCPSDYYVKSFGMDKKIRRHIHYRIESDKFPGLFSSVKTHYVKC